MHRTSTKSAFWDGLRSGAPFLLIVGPFGMLFGVVGTEAGLNLSQVMVMTILVIAGSSQFTAVQLMSENAPSVIVLLTALAVNLRMAMYSASLVPHLGAAPFWQRALISYLNVDQAYALSIARYEREPGMPLPDKIAFFMGVMALVAPLWYATTYIGAVVGQGIPPQYALDFALPITFIALVAPAIKSLPHLVAAFISGALTLAFIGLPAGIGLLLAAVIAMTAGAELEAWLERRT
ncbi:MAG: AzlC family ABC transporter permease [Pseudomonadota bacterium]